MRTVYGTDSQLIADGTYLVAETVTETAAEFHSTKNAPILVGCGGWSKRKTLYGGDQWSAREDSLLDPAKDAAKIRAFFIHPDWVRRGIGTLILNECERAAVAAGFTRFEMGATLTGVAMYKARGYVAVKDMAVPLEDGLNLPIVHMVKTI